MLYSLVYFILLNTILVLVGGGAVMCVELNSITPTPTHLVSADKAQDGFKVLFIKLNFQLVLLR